MQSLTLFWCMKTIYSCNFCSGLQHLGFSTDVMLHGQLRQRRCPDAVRSGPNTRTFPYSNGSWLLPARALALEGLPVQLELTASMRRYGPEMHGQQEERALEMEILWEWRAFYRQKSEGIWGFGETQSVEVA